MSAIQRLLPRGRNRDSGSDEPGETKVEKIAKASLKDRSRLKTFHPAWGGPIKVVTGGYALYFLWTTFVRLNLNIQLAIYLGITLSLIFLVYKARESSPATRPSAVDLVLVVLALAPCANFLLRYEEITRRAGIVTDLDLLFAAMITIASFEGCRRVLGWSLPVVAAVVVIYALYGNYFPELVAHAGMSPQRVAGTIYGTNGVFGLVTRTFAVFVVVFIIFGAFLQQSGAGTAFTNLAIAAFGRRPGGAAKAAVISSGLAGSVLGSGAANIAVTGTFTIPLMKKRGYTPEVAAAYETVASIGGHLMPPVMGAAAFIMASFIGVPYFDIVKIAAIPALLLYMTLYASVHFYTGRHNLERAQVVDPAAPKLRRSLVIDGPLLAPLFVLVVTLGMGYSPFRSAVFATIAAIVTPQLLRLVSGHYGFTIRQMGQALVDGGIQSLTVGASAGVLGVLVGSLLLPGTGLTFSSWIVHLSGGRLFLALILVIMASYILGMGMTVTAAYIIIAVVAAPALTQLGVAVIVAHLVIIWFSQDSSFTPPFALGAFIAAGIADASPMKTAWRSVLVGKPMYYIPFLMIYTPLLGLEGWTPFVYWTIFAAGLGLIMTASVAEQYLVRNLAIWESVALGAGALLLWYPNLLTGLIGLGIFLLIYLRQKRIERGEEGSIGSEPVTV